MVGSGLGTGTSRARQARRLGSQFYQCRNSSWVAAKVARPVKRLGFDPRPSGSHPELLLRASSRLKSLLKPKAEHWSSLPNEQAPGTGLLPWHLGFGMESAFGAEQLPPEPGQGAKGWNGNEGSVCARGHSLSCPPAIVG